MLAAVLLYLVKFLRTRVGKELFGCFLTEYRKRIVHLDGEMVADLCYFFPLLRDDPTESANRQVPISAIGTETTLDHYCVSILVRLVGIELTSIVKGHLDTCRANQNR